MGEGIEKARAAALRRRRENVLGGRQYEHKVKVSAEEEALLLRLAGEQHVTIPRLLVESTVAAADRGTMTPVLRREVITELFALHRLLAAVSLNVNQIAKATNATGEVQAELVETLRAVRRIAERIDDAVDNLPR